MVWPSLPKYPPLLYVVVKITFWKVNLACYEVLFEELYFHLAATNGGYLPSESNEDDQKTFSDRARALADLKFTYVVSCQVYGNQKKSSESRDRSCYNNILQLMLK